MTHSSPSRSARVVNPARSDPLPGSLNSWHHRCSPTTIGGRSRCFSSSDPCSRIVGAARPIPEPPAAPTAPQSSSAAATTASAATGRPLPCHSTGHDGQAQPDSSSITRQSCRDRSGSQCELIHACASSRTSSSEGPATLELPTLELRRPPLGHRPNALGEVVRLAQSVLLGFLMVGRLSDPLDQTGCAGWRGCS